MFGERFPRCHKGLRVIWTMNLVTGATALSEDAVEMEYIHDCCVWQFLSSLPAHAGGALTDVPVDHEKGGTMPRVTTRSLFPPFLHPGT